MISCARYSPLLYKARRKIGSTPCRHNPSGMSTNFLWFSPKNIHLIARSKRSLTICLTSRRTQRSRFDYVRRFKVEKAKIVGCNDSIARAAFQKGLPADHPLFRKLIMKEDLTLADSFSLAEKHALWDEARQCTFKDLKKYPTSPL
ncbi:hypothetical protein ACFX19_026377 [Malus domestica]